MTREQMEAKTRYEAASEALAVTVKELAELRAKYEAQVNEYNTAFVEMRKLGAT